MTSVISLPRSDLALWEPSTHFTASTTFDLPEPLGPTTTEMPLGNSSRVLSAKLLKPKSSKALSMKEISDCGLRIADCPTTFQSAIRNPKSEIGSLGPRKQ